MSLQRFASWSAYAAAALFAAMFASFGLPSTPAFDELKAALGVLSHAALLPVIAALAAPAWARTGGYAWALGDIVLNVATLNTIGLPAETQALVMGLRYGLHVCAAVWLLAAAAAARGLVRAASAALALALGGFSFVAPFVPPAALYPVMVLLVGWLVVLGRALGKGAALAQGTGALSPS